MRVLRLAAADDAGRIVNPLLAEGQVVGGSVQGLGQCLVEEAVYDESGQLADGIVRGLQPVDGRGGATDLERLR